MKARFLESGGVILEDTAFRSAEVYPEGVSVRQAPHLRYIINDFTARR